MIDALFWYTGLIAWVLIVFGCPRSRGTLRSSVWLHKRARAGAWRPPDRHFRAAS